MPSVFDGATAGRYVGDAEHAYLTLSYAHKGLSHPVLLLRHFDAVLDLDVDDPAASAVRVDVDVASIDSGVDRFDEHLRSADFFDVATYPQARFVSTSFVPSAHGGALTGDLTIRNVTRPVTLDVTLNKALGGSKPAIGFSASGKLQRSDFGIGKYVPAVGDEVELGIEIEFYPPVDSD